MHSVLCLIVTLVTRALCFVFYRYVTDSHTLCGFRLLGELRILFVFDCHVSDTHTPVCVCLYY